MAEENQENFLNTKIKITNIVKGKDSLRSASSSSSLFNLSVTQQIMTSSVSDTNLEERPPEVEQSLAYTSLAIARHQNLALVENHYVNLLQDIKMFHLKNNAEQNMPTTMTSLPSIALNDLRDIEINQYIQLPGTHTTATATEDLITTQIDTIDACAQTLGHKEGEYSLEVLSISESTTSQNERQLKEVGIMEIQQNFEQIADILSSRNSSDFIQCIPQIITDSMEIEEVKPTLWVRIKVSCVTLCNMVGDFLCHNKEFFVCLAFFGGFVICTAFLTAFFYEILTIDPEHILYPTINDKVYFSDRQSKY